MKSPTGPFPLSVVTPNGLRPVSSRLSFFLLFFHPFIHPFFSPSIPSSPRHQSPLSSASAVYLLFLPFSLALSHAQPPVPFNLP